jgi:hypothetical protein
LKRLASNYTHPHPIPIWPIEQAEGLPLIWPITIMMNIERPIAIPMHLLHIRFKKSARINAMCRASIALSVYGVSVTMCRAVFGAKVLNCSSNTKTGIVQAEGPRPRAHSLFCLSRFNH